MCACSEARLRPGWRRALVEALCLVALAGLLAYVASRVHPLRAEVAAARQPDERISAAQARELAGRIPALWIDARPAKDFAQGHVPGALRLTEAEWEALLEPVIVAWGDGQPLLVYCGSADCGASAGVAARLRRELGAGNVQVVEGGWEALAR